MTVLVTGGAGYIGAHVVRLARACGLEVLVVDDFSTGDVRRLDGTAWERLDLAARDCVPRLAEVMRTGRVTSVIHLAARKQVAESVARPLWYYQQNVAGLAHVLAAMELASVDRLVFSSSAAVYGEPDDPVVHEDAPTRPLSAYGETKLVGEWLVRAATRAWGLRGVSLRYFNVVGAGSPALRDTGTSNLVTQVMDRLSRGLAPQVFGTDYPTTDGSCVRDFVDVVDVADAHLAAIEYLERPARAHDVFNVGTGSGSSVLDVVTRLTAMAGSDLQAARAARRPGDVAVSVASVDRIAAELGWHARRGLADALAGAWSGARA
ncbi:UDP-glucose 4-epimerase GalE [Cellulomonas soli]|uniref:UDP-glucose 4-epimerase n=1 Tax=Cellulomonas soli TaxID=931535 RepID=A0A512PHL8_9CELL|nr:UDP-glucose 4-epimerase GalE [Cellulomonas soli]NYI60794.1 UDP-glucose 4-epimerase [Cellulomonas soli]GEP70622.1 UDP-glucose 4-epimerase GalE [Cellulomonas soli]